MTSPNAPRQRLLLISMYPLDQGMWGPTVRISNLRRELEERVRLDLVAGYRATRRLELARYALSGRLRGLDGIYVESSTFLPAEADVAFLALGRALGIPVLTYIRDAYQLFPEYYSMSSFRRRLGARAFLPAINLLSAVSSQLAFPSRGLARVVRGRDEGAVIIPPGSPRPLSIPRRPAARSLLFVGNGTVEAQGAERLIRAVASARQHGGDVRLITVSRPGEEPRGVRPPWLRVLNAEGGAIASLLPDVIATVIPRPRGRYNDLAVPVKLYDYLAFGRPLLVTDCSEQASVVAHADAGMIVGDDERAMADGVLRMIRTDRSQLDRWSANAVRAARANSWGDRADTILETLNITP
jgi:glycosyltransferase involved in cell wall biosynthesis